MKLKNATQDFPRDDPRRLIEWAAPVGNQYRHHPSPCRASRAGSQDPVDRRSRVRGGHAADQEE